MLIKVVVVKKNIAFRLKRRVASGAPCLLNIILKGIGYIVMNNQFNVFFIHAHTESGGRDYDFYFIAYKGFLIGYFFTHLHFAVKGFCREAVACKFFRQL